MFVYCDKSQYRILPCSQYMNKALLCVAKAYNTCFFYCFTEYNYGGAAVAGAQQGYVFNTKVKDTLFLSMCLNIVLDLK